MRFIRSGNILPVTPENLCSASRRSTNLSDGATGVQTVEHLLFSLLLFDVSWDIVIDGPEIPIMDGSALPFVKPIQEAGIPRKTRFFQLNDSFEIVDGDSRAFISPCEESMTPEYQLQIAFPQPIGISTYLINPQKDDLAALLAPARTFVMEAEIPLLESAGLARGGSLDNALVIGANGPINSGGMRFANEPARHKMLDLIGDLALLGALPNANINIVRPGHRLNHQIVVALQNANVARQNPTTTS